MTQVQAGTLRQQETKAWTPRNNRDQRGTQENGQRRNSTDG